MWLLRPHRAVAPAPRAPTDARGDHARTPPRILRLFSAVAKCQIRSTALRAPLLRASDGGWVTSLVPTAVEPPHARLSGAC